MSKAQIYLIAAIIFALIVAIFAVQNTEKMAIYFLFWQVKEVSKVIIILASTASGALVMLCLGFMWSYKKIKYIRLLEAELKEAKKRLETSSGKEPAAGEHQQANC
jgi:uncharacterized integral membrane protein